MHEVFNSAVDALAQLGSTSHSAELVDLVSTVDELKFVQLQSCI
jgi:HEAT repeat protein